MGCPGSARCSCASAALAFGMSPGLDAHCTPSLPMGDAAASPARSDQGLRCKYACAFTCVASAPASMRSSDVCLPCCLSPSSRPAKEIIVTKGNLSTALLTTVLTFSATVASAQLSRDEVMAQLKAAQASGEFAALVGQDSGSAYLSSHVHSSESRGNVQTQVNEAVSTMAFEGLA